jgi:lysophospholipase L1-like esterase
MADAPFQRMVVIGDSISYGMCASRPENEWNQVVARLLARFQDKGPTVFNRGLPAGVISPRCPGFPESTKPSLQERYQEHCIDLEPDLVVIAEGLNDMRSGMPLQDYLEDLESITSDIQHQTGAVVVIVGIYHQAFGKGANDPLVYPTWTRWTQDIAKAYNLAMGLTAERLSAVFVDTQRIMGGADWLLHVDSCHLNDLGHVLVGNGIFEAIARHQERLADETFRTIAKQDVSILNTGGADTDQAIRDLWAGALARFSEHLD